MQDCTEIKDKLLDFVFDELTFAEKTAVAEHAKICRACRAELLAAQKTLQIYGDNAAALEPTAREWQVYETALRARFEPQPQIVRADFFKRFFTAGVRVPAPVFAAALLLFGATLFFAARGAFAPPIQNQQIVRTPQIIEKPIETVIEKIVTREKIVKEKVFVAQKRTQTNRAPVRKSAGKAVEQINFAEFKPVAKSTLNVEKIEFEKRK